MSRPCENCGSDTRVCKDCDLYNGKLVEQKIGYWKYIDYRGNVECSEYGFATTDDNLRVYHWIYCPMCGSYNRRE